MTDVAKTFHFRANEAPINDGVNVNFDDFAIYINKHGFLPTSKILCVKDKEFGALGDGTTDDTTAIQAAITAANPGDTIYFPNGTYIITSTLTLTETMMLAGSPGRDFFDNSWDGEGGSVIHMTGNSTAISWAAPNSGNSRIGVYMRDLLVRGGKTSNSRTAGVGLSVNGRQQSGTFVRILLDNTHFCEHPEEGLYITGAVYGGALRNVSAFSNGYSGIFVDGAGLTDPIGEMYWSQIRCFSNGGAGSTTQEKAGFFYHPSGGSNIMSMVSCSNNTGHGIVLQGGNFTINGLQLESNSGTIQAQIADGTSYGVTACLINGLKISPGSSYTGTLLKIEDNAENVAVKNCFFGDTLGVGGKDILIDSGAGGCCFEQLSGTHTLVTDDNSAEINYLDNVHFLATVTSAQTNITGDDTDATIVFNNEIADVRSNYDASTGIFTAPMSGLYTFSACVESTGFTAAHDRGKMALVTTARTFLIRGGSPAATKDANDFYTLHGSWGNVYLAEGDTAKIVFTITGDTKVVDTVADGTASWFMGKMVKQ